MTDLASFCAAHPVPPLPPGDARWMLESLVSGPDKVLALEDAHGLALVAAVIDTCANVSDAGDLVLLGRRGDDPALVERALAWAAEAARRGPRARLDVDGPELSPFDAPLLARHGFAEAYRMYAMARPPGAPMPAVAPIAPPLRFASLEESHLETYFETVSQAFAQVPGAYVPSYEDFRARAIPQAAHVRVLVDGARVVGFVRIAIDDDGGEIRSLGRHPSYRAAGLGPALLAEGLRMLAAAGVERARLEVAAQNESALALYRRFGFECTRTTSRWRRELR